MAKTSSDSGLPPERPGSGPPPQTLFHRNNLFAQKGSSRNRDEAKFILRSVHLGGEDIEDPQFKQALDLSRKDAELGAWVAQEQTIDARISQKFRNFHVPPDLKGQLLAARKIIPAPAWWQRPVWVSAAACLVVVLSLGAWLLSSASQPRFAEFRTFVAGTAAQIEHLDVLSTNLVALREWLVNQNAPADFVVPTGLVGRPSVGCRKFNWKGQPVSLVCFKVDGVGTVHLFVIEGANLHNLPADLNPKFTTDGNGVTTASWKNNNRVYVLAAKVEERELRRLLTGASV